MGKYIPRFEGLKAINATSEPVIVSIGLIYYIGFCIE